MESLPTPSEPRATFRAKSAGVSLVVILGVGAYYLANLIAGAGAGAAGLALSALVLVIVVESALQAALAIGAGGVPAAGERDRAAADHATRIAYPVLVAGALATFASWLLGAAPGLSAHMIALALVLAESVRLSAQLIAYRSR